MMKNSYLAQLPKDDAMRVDINVTFANLSVVSHYLGMLGKPSKGGLDETAFRGRQAQHRRAEIAAVGEVPQFITKAQQIYGYPHFLNDASGSLCELIDPEGAADPVLASVTDNTVLVYIQPDASHEARLVESARLNPKPLYFRPEFLDKSLEDYIWRRGFVIRPILILACLLNGCFRDFWRHGDLATRPLQVMGML